MQLTFHRRRRKAISGILAAVIFFAMLFSAGMSLILYTLSSFNSQNQAQAAAIQSQQVKSAENLLLRSCDSSTKNQLPNAAPYNTTTPGYPYNGANICVWIQNDGSVPVTIVGTWILDATTNAPLNGYSPDVGSSAPVTEYPSGASIFPSGLTLSTGSRVVLDVGAGANSMKSSSDSFSITFVTLTGNQFSAVYPPPAFNINVNSGASLTTQLSEVLVPPGGSVSDTATLAGVPATTTGFIDFYVTDTNVCPSLTATQVGVSIPVSGSGNYGPSPTYQFTTRGTYYWYANFTDTSNRQITSPCEPLTVGNPTITVTTTLSPTSVSFFPATVTDTATITGTSDATGYTMKYFYFTDGICSTPAGGNSAGAVTVSGISVPPSNPITFQTKGSYSFYAQLYDTAGLLVTTSTCEPLPVNNQPISVTTSLLPPILSSIPETVVDTAVISGISNAQGYTVQYFYFGDPVQGISNGGCTGSGTSAGVVTISAGTVAPSSNPITYKAFGNYSWDAQLFDQTGNPVATSACERLQTVTTVSSAFGLGFISLDFNSYKALYTNGNCFPGITPGCTVIGGSSGDFVKNAPLAYTIPSPQTNNLFVIYSLNITNTDPAGRNIVLDSSSVLDFLSVPSSGQGGGTFSTYPWFIGNISSSGVVATTFPTSGIVIPNHSAKPNGVTIYFTVEPTTKSNQWSQFPPPGVDGVFMYLHGVMGVGCNSLTCAGTPIGQNEPLVETLFTGTIAPTLTETPSQGPATTVISIGGFGFPATTTYSYCLSTSPTSTAACVAGTTGGTFTTDSAGNVLGSPTLTVPSGTTTGSYYVIAYQVTTVTSSILFTVTTPTLTLNPNSGAVGSTVSLTGAGFEPSTVYAYCFSSSASTPCASGTSTIFTTTSSGNIPSGTGLVVPSSGNSYVDVNTGNIGTNFIADAAFTVVPTVVQSGFATCTSSPCTAQLASAVSSGDELVVSVATSVSGSTGCATAATPTDGLGTAFTSAGATTISNSTTGSLSCAYAEVFYAPVPGSGGASDTVTVTLSGGPATSGVIQVYEVSGVDTATSPQVSQGTCTSCSSVTTTALSYPAQSLLIGVGATGGTTISTLTASGGSPSFTATSSPSTAQYVGYSTEPVGAGTAKTFTANASGTSSSLVLEIVQFALG